MKTVKETRNDRVNRMSRAYDELREAEDLGDIKDCWEEGADDRLAPLGK